MSQIMELINSLIGQQQMELPDVNFGAGVEAPPRDDPRNRLVVN
jgi:hypothetical protein